MRATTLALALCIAALVSAPHAQYRIRCRDRERSRTAAGASIPGATVRLTGQAQTPLTTAYGRARRVHVQAGPGRTRTS